MLSPLLIGNLWDYSNTNIITRYDNSSSGDNTLSSYSSESEEILKSIAPSLQHTRSKLSIKDFTSKLKNVRLSNRKQTKCLLEESNTNQWLSIVDACNLSNMWGIGINQAKDTLKFTMQSSVGNITNHMTRYFRTQKDMFRWRRFCGKIYTNTVISDIKNIFGNNCA